MGKYNLYTNEMLVEMLTANDEKAFNEIYLRYWEKLYAISYRYCSSKEISEEIVQDIFMTLWDRRSQVIIENLPAYLATACKFSVYKYLVKEKRRKELLIQHINGIRLAADEEAYINSRFLQSYINDIVETLPPQCKAVFCYSRQSGFTTSEIAEKMEISSKTVESHLTKALKQIKLSLKKIKSLFF